MLRNLKMHWRRLRNAEMVTIRGVKVRTARDEIPKRIRSLLFKGIYETDECDLVESEVRPGDRVLEVGAGIGLVSLLATRICGQDNVLSCEANPDLESMIRENYRLNGWKPNLVMQAVTSNGHHLEFFRSDNVFSSSVIDRGLAGDRIFVESIAVNELIGEHRPSIIVMDAEGSEVELMAAADLSQVRAVIVEMHPQIVGEERIASLVRDTEAKGFHFDGSSHKVCLFRNTMR